MIVAVRGVSLEALVNYLAPFFELRRKEFVERLKWDLVVIDGLEIDEFDTNEGVYLLLIDSVLGLVGGMRFLPTTRPNMIKDVFSEYLYPGCEAPLSPKIIESTRFFIADDYKTGGLIGIMKRPAVELLLAMIEYAIAIGQEKIATFLYSSLKTSI